MSDAVIAGIFGLVGIILTAYLTRNSIMNELDKRIAVIDTKLIDMGNDIREHNHYAKMFQETVPVLQEQIKNLHYRINDVKEEIREVENDNERRIDSITQSKESN